QICNVSFGFGSFSYFYVWIRQHSCNNLVWCCHLSMNISICIFGKQQIPLCFTWFNSYYILCVKCVKIEVTVGTSIFYNFFHIFTPCSSVPFSISECISSEIVFYFNFNIFFFSFSTFFHYKSYCTGNVMIRLVISPTIICRTLVESPFGIIC